MELAIAAARLRQRLSLNVTLTNSRYNNNVSNLLIMAILILRGYANDFCSQYIPEAVALNFSYFGYCLLWRSPNI